MVVEPETLTSEEIRDLLGQDIMNKEGGKQYLEHTLLTVPGAPWTISAITTTVLQVTQYKGVPWQAVNTLRSITYMLEGLEDDARSARIMSKVKESLGVEGKELADRVKEATSLVDRAAAAAEVVATLSCQAAEDAAAVTAAMQVVSTMVTNSTTQINETTTTY